jgi:hypothetical protein
MRHVLKSAPQNPVLSQQMSLAHGCDGQNSELAARRFANVPGAHV